VEGNGKGHDGYDFGSRLKASIVLLKCGKKRDSWILTFSSTESVLGAMLTNGPTASRVTASRVKGHYKIVYPLL